MEINLIDYVEYNSVVTLTMFFISFLVLGSYLTFIVLLDDNLDIIHNIYASRQ